MFFRLLRNRSLAVFWMAQAISQTANAFHLLALPLWVYSWSGSSIVTGTVAVLEIIPILLCSPFAGVLADRLNRKLLLVSADIGRALLVSCLFLVQDVSQLWVVYTVAIGTGIMSSFFVPTQMAVIQGMVPKEQLPHVNSLFQLSMSASLLIGPMVGGVVVAVLGYQMTFLINAVSFVIGALGSLFIRTEQALGTRNFRDVHFLHDIKEGYEIVRGNLQMRQSFLAQLVTYVGMGANGVLFVMYLQDAGASSQKIGMYMSAQGVGMVLASFVYPSFVKKASNMWLPSLLALMMMGPAVALFIQVVPNYHVIGILLIFLFGLMISSFNVGTQTVLQMETPPHAMGRVAGLSRVINQGATALSTMIGSVLAGVIGPQSAVTVGGMLVFLASLGFWLSRPRTVFVQVDKKTIS